MTDKKNPLYVRVKRLDTTYFIMCDEYENVESITKRVAALSGKAPEDIRLYLDKKVSPPPQRIAA